MTVLFWGLTLGMIGKVLLGVSVMLVHAKIVKEHKIDGIVLKEMRRERTTALIGILFILAGFFLELAAFGYLPMFAEPAAVIQFNR